MSLVLKGHARPRVNLSATLQPCASLPSRSSTEVVRREARSLHLRRFRLKRHPRVYGCLGSPRCCLQIEYRNQAAAPQRDSGPSTFYFFLTYISYTEKLSKEPRRRLGANIFTMDSTILDSQTVEVGKCQMANRSQG